MTALELKLDSIAIDFLKTAEHTNTNIFLTWDWWTGKSFLTNYHKSKTKKKFICLWTTWTASLNIWWVTIHRFFWIMKDGRVKWMSKEKIDLIKDTDLFYIDEVSMMRADLFDLLDYVLRKATWVDELFWWKQIIFIWDLFQLPPVLVQYWKDDNWNKIVTEEYEKFVERYKWRFFFHANRYDASKFKTISLTKVHRQNDIEMVTALNLIREWRQNSRLLDLFNKRVTLPKDFNPKAIYVASTNRTVDQMNRIKLDENKNPKRIYKALIKGEFEKEEYPVNERLAVKVDCRVMFIANDIDGRFSNWTLWTVKEMLDNKIIIEDDHGLEIELEKQTWKNVVWEDEIWEDIIWWTFTHYPIKWGHAITIHKSQWKSFENMILDVWYGCRESGMLYTWLSRARTLEGIQIAKPLKLSDIKADPEVTEFLNQ